MGSPSGWSDVLDELERQRAQARRVREHLRDLTAHQASPDRLVAVTVNARGLLVDLHIAQSAMRKYRGEQLAVLIQELTEQADAELRRHRDELVAQALESAPSPGYADVPGGGR